MKKENRKIYRGNRQRVWKFKRIDRAFCVKYL